MNRLFALTYGAAAFAAGMMLVHCSSSNTVGPVTTHDGGKSDAPTTTGPGSGKDSGTTTPHDATPGSGSGSDGGTVTTKDSGTVKDTGTTTTKDSGGGLTDTYDAGPCVGPAGGAACDPGNVECNDMQCPVPGHVCCNDGTTPACVGVTATCNTPITCDEKSDCPDGQFCCLVATSASAFKIECQTAACTVNNLGSTQICKTNAECPNGSCNIYSCGGQITEACASPSTFECTQM